MGIPSQWFFSQRRSRWLYAVWMCLFLQPLVAVAGSPDDDQHYQSSLKLVERLLTKSSVAMAVAQSGDSENDPNYYLQQAKKAHAAGDKKKAMEMLEKAKKAMFKAGKKAGAGKSKQEKLDRDYQKKIESAEAMLDALKRIHKEKPRGEEGEQLEQQVSEKILQAKNAKASGSLTQAKQVADQAFLLARQSVVNLRDGDTLVRSLNFANKEEEYRYELDRNDTHKMLVTLLAKDKMKIPDVKKRVEQRMAKAEGFRQQAETEASARHFDKAVELLEQSTKFIIQAIRAAGIYIPG